jgi:hypothetical protein
MSSTIINSLRSSANWLEARASSENPPPSDRLREAFRRTGPNDANEDQPMDVDGEQQEPGARNASSSGVGASTPGSRGRQTPEWSLVEIDDSNDEEAWTQGRGSTTTAAARTAKGKEPKETAAPIDELKLLPRLSALLNLDKLWETLSECLLELGHTPDHHAVLVLQVRS